MLNIKDILIEYRNNSIGLDVEKPRFSWKIESNIQNSVQLKYSIAVKSENNILWESGIVESDQSIHIEYSGRPLSPRTRYGVNVNIWDNHKMTASKNTTFETGQMGKWEAKWITHTLPESAACPIFSKSFNCSKKIESARIYTTALGMYEIQLNDRRVSDEYFSPGWTSYKKRIQYQTYDITEYLAESNELSIIVANGWFKGNLAYQNRKNIYGNRSAVIAELYIQYKDGTSEVVLSDKSWKCTTGEIRYSEIYHGETIDKTFVPEEAKPVDIYEYTKSTIVAQECEPVRIIKHLSAKELIITPKGETVLDFGQNLTGFVEFSNSNSFGSEITLKHAEVLDQEGNFYLENIRAAKVTDKYISNGLNEIYRPHFTFHGFRYVMIEGLKTEIDLTKFKACVLHTDMKETGSFHCSNELVNQLQHNIEWGQRGNFLDIPTDCPQRDERLGWTGDAQVFASTAVYNFNTELFFKKWLRDLTADQGDAGEVPFVIPDVLIRDDGKVLSSAAWGDAAVIIPWILYRAYGDKRILENQYSSMKGWIDYLLSEAGNEYLWKTGAHFGDWLGLDMEQYFAHQKFSVNASTGATDKYYIASAFFAYSTELFIKVADELGKTDDVQKYKILYKNIIGAFRNEYVTNNGRLVCETQTGMLLALKFDLVEEKFKDDIAKRLVTNIMRHNMQMVTGFVGASYICPVLTEYGYHDIAGELLLQTKYPSWLYPITKGATTIWERWNGIKPDGSFESAEMNSFNHYAYGARGDWMYKKLLGISEIEPGYKMIRISPMPIKGIGSAEGSHETPYGTVKVSWKNDKNLFKLDVVVPVNTTARIEFPSSQQGVTVGSGEYHFE